MLAKLITFREKYNKFFHLKKLAFWTNIINFLDKYKYFFSGKYNNVFSLSEPGRVISHY